MLAYDCLQLSPSPGGTSFSWLLTAPTVADPGGRVTKWVSGFDEGNPDRLFFSADGSKAALVLENRATVLDLADGPRPITRGARGSRASRREKEGFGEP